MSENKYDQETNDDLDTGDGTGCVIVLFMLFIATLFGIRQCNKVTEAENSDAIIYDGKVYVPAPESYKIIEGKLVKVEDVEED